MFHSGKCPHCQATISSVKVETITIKGGDQSYKGVTYVCPHCHAVISVSMDQIALNGDLVTRLLKALHKG
jgi:predicted Zn finger-like uncharacterized protein